VIHEHEALELASAALDFPLSPAEQRELDIALAECEICTERAGAYQEQRRLMAQLPAYEVSDATRQRIARAAVAGQVDGGPPMVLLAAALLLAALLAVAVGVGALNNQRQPSDLGIVEPPISTAPSALASPPVAIASPAATTPPDAGSPSDFAKDTIVTVVSNNVRVRSQPRVADDSIKYEPLLRIGDRMFVVRGPVVANDYDWYEVAPVGVDAKRPWTSLPSGWIARGDHDGTPWVAADTPRCPAEPVEIGALAAMHPLERLACFGSRPLAFRAVILGGAPPVACDPAVAGRPCVTGPDWLAGIGGRTADATPHRDVASLTSGPTLALDPAGGVDDSNLTGGRVATIEGSFDHPAAAACSPGATPPGQAAFSAEEAALQCRERFVVTRAVPARNSLEPDTVAVTVSNNVRVRSLPVVSEASVRLTPLLDTGTGVFVLDGPSIGSGFDWYEVVVPTLRDGAGMLIGWVSVASKTDEPWVAPAKLDCPSADGVTVAVLSKMVVAGVDQRLQCFGAHEGAAAPTLRFQSHVRPNCDDRATLIVPAWLALEGPTIELSDGTHVLMAKAHPSLASPVGCSDVDAKTMFQVEGRYDDPASSSCRANPDRPGTPIDARVAAYRCRNEFVVTGLTQADSP
jgi:hypothetical protein